MRFFDPDGALHITQRRLPHWAQAGVLVFITWRTADSLPKKVVQAWLEERSQWLRIHGIDPSHDDWKEALQALRADLRSEFTDRFTSKWHANLDACLGECVLRSPEMAGVVADSLLHFDGAQYQLETFVIMPNHVHVLVSFTDSAAMLNQCNAWKRFTARAINSKLGRSGHFWQAEVFDHLVRSEAQFQWLLKYIEQNPANAGLKDGEYLFWRRRGTQQRTDTTPDD